MSAEVKTKIKTGGRVKGTPNKKTEDFFNICEEMGHNPIEFNILVAQNDWAALGYDSATTIMYTKAGDPFEVDRIDMPTRLAANNKLLDFMYPKRKSVELSTGDDDKKGFIVLGYDPNKLKEKNE